MHTVKLDLHKGIVSIDSNPLTVDNEGTLSSAIAKLCSQQSLTDEGPTYYRLASKASIFGKSADVVIEVCGGIVYSVAFLFDFIEFFESSILDSRILKACEKSLNMKFVSPHPSTAILNSSAWGQAKFSYDPKQGDLSLDIIFERQPCKSASEHEC
ncbi:hypothetical protein [Pseudoduganella armeniaca]|uniref:hypothetical protein n=1 Tax=Pseudoduganella armeniaca TaxID=2072590 RepID=UPI0011B1E297|nr:hypothetical protein [Pseudoduganella armeniaca]